MSVVPYAQILSTFIRLDSVPACSSVYKDQDKDTPTIATSHAVNVLESACVSSRVAESVDRGKR